MAQREGLRVRLRRAQFETRARSLGLESQSAQARAIGVHVSIHHRALKNVQELSGPYVLGVLLTIGDEHVRAQVRQVFDVAADVAKAS